MALAFFFSILLKTFHLFSIVYMHVCLGVQCVYMSADAVRGKKKMSDP